MEILKYKKKKSNIYEVYFNDGSCHELYDDVIIKTELFIKKKVTKKDLDKILEYNNSLKAYYKSLKYISAKLRSEKEIETYLLKNDFKNEDIISAIEKLKQEGFLNHDVFIRSYINDAYNFKQDGPLKVKNNLIMLGFDELKIIPFLNLDYETKAKKIIDKKLKYNKQSNTMFKIKIKAYLNNLGYPNELFIDYLNDISVDNNDKIKKDFQLLMKKYEKKYEKEKLYYFIKDKLFKKGYNSEEISEVMDDVF